MHHQELNKKPSPPSCEGKTFQDDKGYRKALAYSLGECELAVEHSIFRGL